MKKNIKYFRRNAGGVLLLLISAYGCGSAENSGRAGKPTTPSSVTSGATSTTVNTPIKTPIAPAGTSTFDSISQQMAKDAAAERAQEDKRMQNSNEQLRMMLAQQDARDAKSRDSQQIDQIVSALGILTMTDAMKYATTPDSRKCYKGSPASSLMSEAGRIINFKSASSEGVAKSNSPPVVTQIPERRSSGNNEMRLPQGSTSPT